MLTSRSVCLGLTVVALTSVLFSGHAARALVPPVSQTVPSWVAVANPAPPAPPVGGIHGLACPAVALCFAVGHSGGISGFASLIERWDGAHWAMVSNPDRAGTAASILASVACAGLSMCFAVGNDDSAAGVLIKRWNGTAWSIVSTPLPAGVTSARLSGISCVSTTSCVAVGSAPGGTSSVLVERWNGVSWIASTPSVPGIVGPFLSDVSCASASSCLAVGRRQTPGTLVPRTLALRWNGISWSTVPSANVANARSELHGVSCPAVATCFAVGSYDTGAVSKTLIERWDGATWSINATPNPVGTNTNVLDDVSCVSVTVCFAAGDTNFASSTLIVRWNGTSWSIVASPNPVVGSELSSIACASATMCMAGGFSQWYQGGNLVERWNGTAWSVEAPPANNSRSTLAAVSCATPAMCMAVGRSITTSGAAAFVESWNGIAWSISPAPTPGGAAYSNLRAVACPTATSCFAVGDYGSDQATILGAFIEHWDGTNWSVATVGDAPGTFGSVLRGVACSTGSSCFAVGDAHATSCCGTQALVARWNGSLWSSSSAENPTGERDRSVSAVSCTSLVSCFAVGTVTTATDPMSTFIERWDGSAWSRVASPNPPAFQHDLYGVSCSSAAACHAVGDVMDSSFGTLAEQWDGAGWSLVSGPSATGASGALAAVSCPDVNCFAVGTKYTPRPDSWSLTHALIERWTGVAWTFAAGPDPAAGVLSGVACPTTTLCFAVGSYGTTGSHPLIERYS